MSKFTIKEKRIRKKEKKIERTSKLNSISTFIFFYWHFCTRSVVFFLFILENICLAFFFSRLVHFVYAVKNLHQIWYVISFLLVSSEFVTLCCTPKNDWKKKTNWSKRKRNKNKSNSQTEYSRYYSLFFLSYLFSFLSLTHASLRYGRAKNTHTFHCEWREKNMTVIMANRASSTEIKKKNLLLNSFTMNDCRSHWKSQNKANSQAKNANNCHRRESQRLSSNTSWCLLFLSRQLLESIRFENQLKRIVFCSLEYKNEIMKIKTKIVRGKHNFDPKNKRGKQVFLRFSSACHSLPTSRWMQPNKQKWFAYKTKRNIKWQHYIAAVSNSWFRWHLCDACTTFDFHDAANA